MWSIIFVAVAQVEDWKSKNQILRNLLRQHGIVGSSSTDPQWDARFQRVVWEDNHIWAKRVLEHFGDTLFVIVCACNRGKQLNIVINIQKPTFFLLKRQPEILSLKLFTKFETPLPGDSKPHRGNTTCLKKSERGKESTLRRQTGFVKSALNAFLHQHYDCPLTSSTVSSVCSLLVSFASLYPTHSC